MTHRHERKCSACTLHGRKVITHINRRMVQRLPDEHVAGTCGSAACRARGQTQGALFLLALCSICPAPSLPLIREPPPSSPSGAGELGQTKQRCRQWQPLRGGLKLRGGAGTLRTSSAINFLTGETVEELTLIDVDSDDDFTEARPVDWLPRGPFLLPEERNKLSYDIDDPDDGEHQPPPVTGGKKAKKTTFFSRWKAQARARYEAIRSRTNEAAAQVFLDMAAKYSCGLGEHWARQVLAESRSRRRKEKLEAARLAKLGKSRGPSCDSMSCLPVPGDLIATAARTVGLEVGKQRALQSGRKRGKRPDGGDQEDKWSSDDSESSNDSSMSHDFSQSEEEDALNDEYEGMGLWEASSEPWLTSNVTRPSKDEVNTRALHVAQFADESADKPEVAALCRQIVRLSKVLSVVGDQASTEVSSAVLAALHESLGRAEAILTSIQRPFGLSRRWFPLPVRGKLLRKVTEIAAEISEQLEEGGDALMDLLPLGVSMIIRSNAARACWRKWLGAHAIAGSRKKMKYCLAIELGKSLERYSSMSVSDNATSLLLPSTMVVTGHVVDLASEALCLMSLCANSPDEVDVLAWDHAFPESVPMVLAVEALTGASLVTAPMRSVLRDAHGHLYGVSGCSDDAGAGARGADGTEMSSSDSEDEEELEEEAAALKPGLGEGGPGDGDGVGVDAMEVRDEWHGGLRKVRACGVQVLKAVIEDTKDVLAKADSVLNAVIMEYPVASEQHMSLWEQQKSHLEGIRILVMSFDASIKKLQLTRASRSMAPDDASTQTHEDHRRDVSKDHGRDRDVSDRDISRDSSSPSKSGRGGEHAEEQEVRSTQEDRDPNSQLSGSTSQHTNPGAGVYSQTNKGDDDHRRSVEGLLLKSAHAGNVGACLFCVLHCGVSLAAKDGRGNTVLHLAAAQGHLDLVRTMRYVGANVSAVNAEGLNPGALAARRGHKAVASWLSSMSNISGADMAANLNEEMHIVAASLSRLAGMRPAPETLANSRGSAAGAKASTFALDLNKLPTGPPAWSSRCSNSSISMNSFLSRKAAASHETAVPEKGKDAKARVALPSAGRDGGRECAAEGSVNQSKSQSYGEHAAERSLNASDQVHQGLSNTSSSAPLANLAPSKAKHTLPAKASQQQQQGQRCVEMPPRQLSHGCGVLPLAAHSSINKVSAPNLTSPSNSTLNKVGATVPATKSTSVPANLSNSCLNKFGGPNFTSRSNSSLSVNGGGARRGKAGDLLASQSALLDSGPGDVAGGNADAASVDGKSSKWQFKLAEVLPHQGRDE